MRPSSSRARGRLTPALIGIGAALTLAASGIVAAQGSLDYPFERPGGSGDDPSQVNRDLSGRSVKCPRVRMLHSKDLSRAGASAYFVFADPWVGYARGRELFLREFAAADGVFGEPDVALRGPHADETYTVELRGVDVYDPISGLVASARTSQIAAWFLDSDYDGRAFCITQAFFPDVAAWDKLARALKTVVDPERFAAFSGKRSLPFPAGKHKRAAVKVIDPRGNEVMRILHLAAGAVYG